MTLCLTCKRYLMDAATCTVDHVRFPDGEVLAAVPFGDEPELVAADRCPDCGVERGGLHHPGCDVAACPRCGDALATCGCLEAG